LGEDRQPPVTEPAAPPWWPARRAFLEAAPDAEGLARLAGDVVPRGSARARAPLAGGMECAVHALDLVDEGGRSTGAVLKRRDNAAVDGRHEWAALHAALPAAVPTPEPVAFDPDGRWFGAPALVMSELPGLPRLDVSRDTAATGELAWALAALHDCDGAGLRVQRPRWDRSVSEDASAYEAAVWRQIAALSGEAGPPQTLVHGDFHPGNALWVGEELTGVIDWENGARGWPGEDLAKCRWYLRLMGGPEPADRFLAAYEAEIGRCVGDLTLCDLSYGVGVLRQAESRAFFLRRSGLTTVTGESIREATRSFIEWAIRSERQ
jgi:aminoglycoside phosphotransferase (APT) family kinase protein